MKAGPATCLIREIRHTSEQILQERLSDEQRGLEAAVNIRSAKLHPRTDNAVAVHEHHALLGIAETHQENRAFASSIA
ncbi:MAG: hypothetical protein JSS97_07165 [Actinobacteria bacterium]|nr:hypothetical protein [Actinomycetota bacterium]